MIQQSQIAQRKEYIDIARGIAIILMVVGHLGYRNAITQVIYTFHMPLFFILSGMTMKTPDSIKEYFKRRLKRVLIPYFLFALIFSLPDFKSWAYVLYGSRNTLNLAGSSTPLWFLPCLFISDSIFAILLKTIYQSGGGTAKRIFLGTATAILAISGIYICKLDLVVQLGLPFSINIAMICLPFLFFGWIIEQVCVMRIKRVFLAITVIASSAIMLMYFKCNLPNSLTEGFNHIELSIGSIGSPLIFYILALVGSTFIITLSGLIHKCRLLSDIGNNTLTCLGIHGVILRIVKQIGIMVNINQYILGFIAIILVITIMLLISKFLKKYIPNLIGY